MDIFIPKQKKVIEVYGDYWHMNPHQYKSDDFNKSTKLTARETWKKDKQKINKLRNAGYGVDVIWEGSLGMK